ncbi:hypothetical protein D9M72_424600 [compost metagenome]
MVDHHITEFFGQGRAPLLGALEVVFAEADIKHVWCEGAPGGDGDGLVVHLPAEPAGDFHRLNLGPRAGGEDTADGLFDAALDFVQHSHGTSPLLTAAGQHTIRNSAQNTAGSAPGTGTPTSDTTGRGCE